MSQPLPKPIYFGSDQRPLFGWLHPAIPGPARRLGLVIANPFGYEAICAHRSLRHVAEAAAAAGIATVRFDHDGTGDSAGDDADPDRVGAWIAGLHGAAELLRRTSRVDAVCILGVRLGALIAAVAGADWPAEAAPLVGMVAIAPVVSGKAYVRELRALQMALGLGEPPPGARVAVVAEGAQEAVGFPITADTKAALSKIDLAREARAPAPAVLVLDRDDLPAADAWIAKLRELAVAVEAERMPGYVDMVADPHKAVVPTAMIERATAWLLERAATVPATATGPAAATPATTVSFAGVRVARGTSPPMRSDAHPAPGVVETTAFIDDDALFGVLSRPSATPSSGEGILLLNAGSVHHVGPNRLYTMLARRWAALGHTVLRVDLSGIGDSPPRGGEPENVVYSDRAVGDVGVALAFLRAQPGVAQVHALGLCSGAYHAFKAAAAGHSVDGVVLINPLTFDWKPGQSLDYPAQAHRVAHDAARYKSAMRSMDKWKKLLRGQVPVAAVARTMARHAAHRVVNRARDVSRRIGVPWSGDLGAALESLARRDVDLRFVFAAGDPGLPLLRGQAGSAVPHLHDRGQLAIEIIDGPDHTFTPVWSQAALTDVLAAALDHPAGLDHRAPGLVARGR